MNLWETFKRNRAHAALYKRGICPLHGKAFTEDRFDPENRAWSQRLCPDCIPSWDAGERERLRDLMRYVGK